mmetsp:Transcript_26260/g.88258  ORF Transcript_26260/g.88258 Transcript_26260/m.88258 type:complete len:266 (-) Transcript_26260:196-993(-)
MAAVASTCAPAWSATARPATALKWPRRERSGPSESPAVAQMRTDASAEAVATYHVAPLNLFATSPRGRCRSAATASTGPPWPRQTRTAALLGSSASQMRAVASFDPETKNARWLASRNEAAQLTAPEWPDSAKSLLPDAASKAWSLWSWHAATTMPPRAAETCATPATASPKPPQTTTSPFAATFQTRRVPSLAADATRQPLLPASKHVNAVTQSAWRSTAMHFPSAPSQTRTLASTDPETIRRWAADGAWQATASTSFACPASL